MPSRSSRLFPVLLLLLLSGCIGFDRYDHVADQDGLVPPDQFAAFGAEQAQATAIGRAFATGYAGPSFEARARQITAAAAFAGRQRDVVSVVADTSANLLTVTFTSGWRKAILPITDGVPAEMTVGLPPARDR